MSAPEDEARALLVASLADPDAIWSLGGFGALAEFRRAAGEPASALADGLGLVSARGAILLDPAGATPIAYETAFAGDWSHAVALCLPDAACVAPRRSALTELGPDEGAARAADRAATLFDLGLGIPQAEACLRSSDPTTISHLRAACGAPMGDPALSALSVDRVVTTRLGRIEAFAGAGGADGPRVCMSPWILRLGRTHAATAPIPAGLIPCAHLHPPHPAKDAAGRPIPFRRDRHAAFQALYARWGDPGHVALKRAIAAGESVGEPRGRSARMVAKVARMQAAALAGA